MIPQKKKEADLEKQLDDDIKKAENNSKELLKDNKPKLAQAVAMKYSKYAIIVIMAVVVGFIMISIIQPIYGSYQAIADNTM